MKDRTPCLRFIFLITDLEIHNLVEQRVGAGGAKFSVGELTLAGQRLSCIRKADNVLYCVVIQVFKLFFGGEKGIFGYGNRRLWQKRYV